jgi:hypothetical protein
MLYLFAKPSNVGADVDGLACSLHRPTVYSRHRGDQSLLIGSARSRHTTVGGGTFSRDAKPPGLDILHCVDRLGTCETKSYMEKLTFTRACRSDVRVITVIMRVPLVESLCQAAMEQIPALEYLLPHALGACGHVLPC